MKPKASIQSATLGKGKRGGSDDDDDDDASSSGGGIFRSFLRAPTSSSTIFSGALPGVATLCVRSVAAATLALYVLNQKHMLSQPVSRVVSRLLFWPTLPITLANRLGRWTTEIDDAVVLGGAPFGWLGYPEKLHRQFNVRGVINMCDEYRGPARSYARLGVEQLRLPTVDHFEPSVDDLRRAVSFISRHEARGGRVYVHCRAGHGRSAAAAYAWLLYKEPLADPVELNEKMCELRNVRKSLWKQPNVNEFRVWLQNGGMVSDSEDASEEDKWSRHTEESTSSDDSASDTDDLIPSKFGQVFSDEETEDSSEGEGWNDDSYEEAASEDEKDYEMWKSYRRDDF